MEIKNGGGSQRNLLSFCCNFCRFFVSPPKYIHRIFGFDFTFDTSQLLSNLVLLSVNSFLPYQTLPRF